MEFGDVSHESDAAILQDTYYAKKMSALNPSQKAGETAKKREKKRTPLNGSPLPKMPRHDFLCFLPIARLFDASHIKRSVLAIEASNTAHIVSVICELVPCKAIL
jgi:hypothetical protein